MNRMRHIAAERDREAGVLPEGEAETAEALAEDSVAAVAGPETPLEGGGRYLGRRVKLRKKNPGDFFARSFFP